MAVYGWLLFYAAGLLLAPRLTVGESFWIVPFCIAGCAVATSRTVFFLPFVALFLFSFGCCQYTLMMQDRLPAELAMQIEARQPVRVEGRIATINSRPEQGMVVDLDAVSVLTSGNAVPLGGRLRVYVDSHDAAIAPGRVVRLLTRLTPPRNFSTPGAFDYVRYLRRRGIVATGYTPRSSDFAPLAGASGTNPVSAIRSWRHRLRQQISAAVDPDAAPFITALAIGDRGGMTTPQRDLLARSGLSHLFAISGLHLGLVASFLYLLLRPLYLRFGIDRLGIPARRLVPPLTFPILVGYLVLTGSAISTSRALFMLGAGLALCCLSRRIRPIDLLAAVAFAFLAFDPLALYEPSFQLSFAGVGGIILVLPGWQKRLARWPTIASGPTLLLIATLAATVATLPLVLLHFHILAPAAPLLNLAAVPLVSFVVIPVLLIGILLSPVSLPASNVLFETGADLLVPVLDLVDACVTSGPLQAVRIHLSPAEVAAIGFGVALILLYGRIPQLYRSVAVAAVLFIGLTSGATISADDRILQLTVLDVGQGDAALLRLPGGDDVLIDGGGLYSDTFDTGERLVAPALARLGVKRLAAVVLTHDHPDHRRGLEYILHHVPVAAFIQAPGTEETPGGLDRVAREEGIATARLAPGWNSFGDSANAFQVYVNDHDAASANDRSIVLYARHGDDGVLLTGDLESTGIRQLLAAGVPGPVTLMKIPHHGSLRSEPSPLLEAYRPSECFISVGQGNRYGLPHPQVLRRIAEAGPGLHRTDIDGTIRFRSAARGWDITHWKKGVFR